MIYNWIDRISFYPREPENVEKTKEFLSGINANYNIATPEETPPTKVSLEKSGHCAIL